ncbi:AI-2E family transporter [Mycoplasma sp. P36-A1]|uniref:AI-2E family transporter n=1 Tax=Mycoplasma sp. P36-A1 TaxID=3252900 RepID=UPI003C2DE461
MDLNKKNIKIISGLIFFTVALLWITMYFSSVVDAIQFIISVCIPFILGLAIAFVVNVLLNQVEKLYSKIFKKPDGLAAKLKRGICLTISILLIIGLIFMLLFLIVPEVLNSIKMVIENFPGYINSVEDLYTGIRTDNNFDFLPEWNINIDMSQLTSEVTKFVSNYGQSFINNTMSAANSLVGTFVTLFLGIVFSVYVLGQKEVLGVQVKKLMYAYLNPMIVEKIKHVFKIASQTFSNFITGQLIECVILGFVCFTGMMIMKIPYAPMISALVAFGALIPVFGAFVATLLGALLIMLVNPLQALIFIAFIVIYQQIDGNVIYPRIVGNSVGLPGIWVLAAVALGGNLAGMVGMLIGVPVFSVLYTLLKEDVYKKLIRKKLVNKNLKLKVDKVYPVEVEESTK